MVCLRASPNHPVITPPESKYTCKYLPIHIIATSFSKQLRFSISDASRRPSFQSFSAAAVRCESSSPAHRPEYIPNRIPDPNYVRIFDTTLRDGEQSPGATMTTKEKLAVACQLARLGVDIIEAGFPASSEADLEAVKLIAEEVGRGEGDHVPVICGLARCNKRDIDKAWEAVKHAKKPRIHTFIATSEIHMNYKLKMSREQVVEKATSMVAYAKSLGNRRQKAQQGRRRTDVKGPFYPQL